MKRIFIIFSFFLLWTTILNAQYSDTTELAYLQIINRQGDNDLISNNLYDAILVTDKILYKPVNNFVNRNLFVESAKSFFVVGKYDIALFYLLSQRILMPSKQLSSSYKDIFYEAAYHYFDKPHIDSLWQSTDYNNKNNITKEDYYTIATLSLSLYSTNLEPFIYKIINIANKKYGEVSYYLQHWAFLTIIKLKEKHIKQIFPYIENKNIEVYKQTTIPSKLRYKIYRKAIKHYIKNNSCIRAKELLKNYSQESLSFFLNIDLATKRVRCKVKSICNKH